MHIAVLQATGQWSVFPLAESGAAVGDISRWRVQIEPIRPRFPSEVSTGLVFPCFLSKIKPTK